MLKFKIGKSNVKVSGILYIGGMTGAGKTWTLIEVAKQNAISERSAFFCDRASFDGLLPAVVDALSKYTTQACNLYVDHAQELHDTRADLYNKIISLASFHNVALGGFQCFDVRMLRDGDAYVRTATVEMGEKIGFTRSLIFPEIGSHTTEICGYAKIHRLG